MEEIINRFARVPQGRDERNPEFINENESNKDLLNEGIVDQSRPALTVDGQVIQTCEIKEIEIVLKPQHELISTQALSVGRIYIEKEPLNTLGTGWVIDGRYIATCYHVMKKLIPSFTKVESTCYIDFNDTNQGNVRRVRIESALGHNESSDVAILKLDSTYNIPNALTTNSVNLMPTRDIYVFGFPKPEDFRNPFSHTKFPGSPYTKRVMPGQVTGKLSPPWFSHDCSTSGGVSGGPIIDLNSGHVIGVHSKYIQVDNVNVGIDIGEFIKILDEKH